MNMTTTRSLAEFNKLEAMVEEKLTAVAKTLASQDDMNEWESLFKVLNDKIDCQNKEISSLKDKAVHHMFSKQSNKSLNIDYIIKRFWKKS